MAELWPRLFPIITYGDNQDVMNVVRYLKTLPRDEHIINVLLECARIKLASSNIDIDFVY